VKSYKDLDRVQAIFLFREIYQVKNMPRGGGNYLWEDYGRYQKSVGTLFNVCESRS